jgi:hypothetical protein
MDAVGRVATRTDRASTQAGPVGLAYFTSRNTKTARRVPKLDNRYSRITQQKHRATCGHMARTSRVSGGRTDGVTGATSRAPPPRASSPYFATMTPQASRAPELPVGCVW